MSEPVVTEVRGTYTSETIDVPEVPDALLLTFGDRVLTSYRAGQNLFCSLAGPAGEMAVLISVAATDKAGRTLALHFPMTPDQARERAAHLVQLANKIDQGRGLD